MRGEFKWKRPSTTPRRLTEDQIDAYDQAGFFVLENGCPHVVPCLHREGTLEHEYTDLGFNCFQSEPEDSVAVPVSAGGIVVFSSLTPHATGRKLTAGIRKFYIVQLCQDGCVSVALGENSERIEIPIGNTETQFPILVKGQAA